ncbi:hypothetical protein EVAR_46174_1 [Eumeta japonica]|uniref:Uncharacterized protein n=1 Tax=Eumeta variegata TaxID=151549 RepID=A0A4C1Y2S3_EUMVA|nr:hypothetical protein EVAR_46174_1 [Eumeta japonica]
MQIGTVGVIVIQKRWQIESRTGNQIENATEVKTECRIAIRIKILTGWKSRIVPKPETKVGAGLGLTARAKHIKDEGMHSMSAWAKPEAEC